MKLDEGRVSALRERAARDVQEAILPACSYALALDGEVIVSETVGDVAAGARFSIWSATKPVFSSVVWQLIGEGALDPAAPVVDLWPEFGAHGKQVVTLEHLLLFTAGFPGAQLELDSLHDRDARVRQMEQWTLDWEPGTQYAYHGLSAHHVMAELVERVTGTDHRTALRQRVLDPLGLDRLELGVPVQRQGEVLPLEERGEPVTAQELAEALGLPSLPEELAERVTAAASAGPGVAASQELMDFQQPHVLAYGLPGGGGVSDASSLALFYQALLHDPKGVWDADVLRTVTSEVRNTFPTGFLDMAANRSLGLEVSAPREGLAARVSDFGGAAPGAFGHGGAAGQIGRADPSSGLSFAKMTNRLYRNIVRR